MIKYVGHNYMVTVCNILSFDVITGLRRRNITSFLQKVKEMRLKPSMQSFIDHFLCIHTNNMNILWSIAYDVLLWTASVLPACVTWWQQKTYCWRQLALHLSQSLTLQSTMHDVMIKLGYWLILSSLILSDVIDTCFPRPLNSLFIYLCLGLTS